MVISYGKHFFFLLAVFYRHVGCYKDELQPNRALPVKLSSVVSSVMQCYQLAKAEGYQAFGTQWGRQCWAGSDATDTYSKHGVATNCTGGMGGWLSNDVYLVKSSGNKNFRPVAGIQLFHFFLQLTLSVVMFTNIAL